LLNETQVTVETDGIGKIDGWATQRLPNESSLGEQLVFGVVDVPSTTVDVSHVEPLRTEEAREAWGDLVADEDVDTTVLTAESSAPVGDIEAQAMEPVTREHTAVTDVDLSSDDRVSIRNQPEPGDAEDPVEQLVKSAELSGLSSLEVAIDDPPSECVSCEGFNLDVSRDLPLGEPSLAFHSNHTRDNTSIDGTVLIEDPPEEVDLDVAMGESETDGDGASVNQPLDSLLVDYEGDEPMDGIDFDLEIEDVNGSDNDTYSGDMGDDPLALGGSIDRFPKTASFSARFDNEAEQADLEEPACGFEATERVPARLNVDAGGDATSNSFRNISLRMGPSSNEALDSPPASENYLGIDTEEDDFHARLDFARLDVLDVDFASGVRTDTKVGDLEASVDAGISDLMFQMYNESREEPAINAEIRGFDNPVRLHCEGARMTLGPDEDAGAASDEVLDYANVTLTQDMPDIMGRSVDRMQFEAHGLQGGTRFEPGILDEEGRYLDNASGLGFHDANGYGHVDQLDATVDLEPPESTEVDCGDEDSGDDGEGTHFILDGSLPVDDLAISMNTEDETNVPGEADAYVVYQQTCTQLTLEAKWTGLNSVGLDTDDNRTIVGLDQDNDLFAVVDVTITDDREPDNDDNNRFEVRNVPERFEVSTSLPHIEPVDFEVWESELPAKIGCIGHMGLPSFDWSGYSPDVDSMNNECVSLSMSDTVGDFRMFQGESCFVRATDLEPREDESLDTSEASAVLFNGFLTVGSVDSCPLASDVGSYGVDAAQIAELSVKAARDGAGRTTDATIEGVEGALEFGRDLDGYTEYNDVPHFGDVKGTFEDARISVVNHTADRSFSADYGVLGQLGEITDEGLPIWWDSGPSTNPNTLFNGSIDHAIPGWEFDARCLSGHFHRVEDDWEWHCHREETREQIAERVSGKYFDNLFQFRDGDEEYTVPPEAFVPMLFEERGWSG
jgi:hypothetical protein